ncbi:MAG TPA: hypothetical protein VEX86_22695 [Longimicrobium sp.]|nr:hypothetical protein [Longimicrobium sp.]
MFDQLLEVQVFVPGQEAGEAGSALDDLDAALEALRVVPLGDDVLVRTPHADATYEINCTNGATCNFKCGPTAYWECGPSSEGSCGATCEGQNTCFGACDTYVVNGCTSVQMICG